MLFRSHLSKSYGSVNAVDDLILSVKRGQVFGFLGPNGAGKSTTIKLLTTLIRPSSGSLSILGIDAILHPLKIRDKIGVVLQQPSYEPTLSVEKSLDKYGMMWDIPKTERNKRMEQLLTDFDLVEIRKKRNEDLSIGQRRRVQVAREFMHDMELLFLDEPTVGLDIQTRRKIWQYIKKIHVEFEMTIFVTTHYMEEADSLCDRIGIMDHGKIQVIDTPKNMKNALGNEIISLVIDTNNNHDSFLKELKKIEFIKKINEDNLKLTLFTSNGTEVIPEIFQIS